MQLRSIWRRAVAGLALGSIVMGARLAAAQSSGEQTEDHLIEVAPGEGTAELQIQPFPRKDWLIEAPTHWIGVGVGPLPELVRKHLQLGDEQGGLVLSVVENSPAAQAGLAKDDVIVSAGGKDLVESDDLLEVVREREEEPLELVVIHEGERKTVTIQPAERPEKYAVVPWKQNRESAWQIVPHDMPNVRNWIERLPQDGDLPLQFRAIGPGMLFDSGQLDLQNLLFRGGRLNLQNLPSDMSVQIVKQGSDPATVKVQKGDQSWEFQADDQEGLQKLPEDVRGAVQAMLGGRDAVWLDLGGLQDRDQFRPLLPPARRAETGLDSNENELEKRMRGIESQLQELVEQVERLQSEK